MADIYTGRFDLNNFTRHKQGKYDEFLEIMKVIQINPSKSSWKAPAKPVSFHICASAPILRYNNKLEW